jgi:hypothetical protein
MLGKCELLYENRQTIAANWSLKFQSVSQRFVARAGPLEVSKEHSLKHERAPTKHCIALYRKGTSYANATKPTKLESSPGLLVASTSFIARVWAMDAMGKSLFSE